MDVPAWATRNAVTDACVGQRCPPVQLCWALVECTHQPGFAEGQGSLCPSSKSEDDELEHTWLVTKEKEVLDEINQELKV